MALRSVSEVLSRDDEQAFDAFLDSGRTTSERSAGSDVSGAGPNANRLVSFNGLVKQVSFDSDSGKITFETLDVASITQMHAYRNAWLRISLELA